MSYALLHVVHLLAAVCFIGTLFFEVLILAQARRALDPGAGECLDRAVGARSRRVLHWLVLFLYGAGIGLAWHHRALLADPFASAFGTLLSIKILLALGVVLCYAVIAVKVRRGRMSTRRYWQWHLAVLLQMLAIVLLAKGMFYLHW